MRSLFKKIQEFLVQLIEWFYFPFLRFIPIETFRYAVTGGANMVFDIVLYYVFYNYVFMKANVDLYFLVISPHIAAFLFVFPITFFSGFVLAKYITFSQSELKGRIQLFRYVLSVAGSILLNYLFLKLFVEVVGWYATFSKIVTTMLVVVYSFLMQKYFTFKTGKRQLNSMK